MVLAWVILLPLGVLIARFFKITPHQSWPASPDNKFWWLPVAAQGKGIIMSADFGRPAWAHAPGTLVIVTGAGSGIGQATAILAARMGLRVAAWDFRVAGAQRTIELAGEHGASITAVEADVTHPGAIDEAMAATTRLGQPTLLVNNAGPTAIGTELPFADALTAAVGSVQEQDLRPHQWRSGFWYTGK